MADRDAYEIPGLHPLTSAGWTRSQATYFIFGGVTPEPTTPVVDNVDPPAGTAIAPADPLSFDVTDPDGFAAILLSAEFPNVPGEELVFNGTNFTEPYAAGSTRVAVAEGFHFELRRAGGWPGPPSLTVYPFDSLGTEG
jgi:hypothetical protein